MADEQVIDQQVDTQTTDTGADQSKPSSIRDSLQKGFDDARTAGTPPDKAAQRRAPQKSRARQAQEEEQQDSSTEGADAQGAVEGSEATAGEEQTGDGDAAPASPPPGWPKEASAEWEAMTPAQQAVVNKRLADSQAGVQRLRSQYQEIDAALQPHMAAIRQFGHTPAAAVSQLFAWFQALAADPARAFPALARSFNVDLVKLVGAAAGQQQQPARTGTADQASDATNAQLPPEIAAALQPYLQPYEQKISELTQRLEGFGQNISAQNEAKTHEVINAWAANRPHFNEVRMLMGQLIASGAVPLKEGRVDLDGAYNAAVWAHPEVREKVMAEQATAKEAARKAAEKAAANRANNTATTARRAAVSVTGGAPGSAGTGEKGKAVKKGQSVRQSILDAIEEAQA